MKIRAPVHIALIGVAFTSGLCSAQVDTNFAESKTPFQSPVMTRDVKASDDGVARVGGGPNGGTARKISFETDGLFKFNGSRKADLLPEGRQKIEALAREIWADPSGAHEVMVTGYADRLGTSTYNDALAFARAGTVRGLLITQGVASARIRVVGVGDRRPVVTQCEGKQALPSLIRCLQPNRRVAIEVLGSN